MNAPDRQGQLWRLSPIPWWPGAARLLTTVPASKLTLADMQLTRGQSVYKTWTQADQRALTTLGVDVGDYTFGAVLSGDDGSSTFVWNPVVIPEAPAPAFAQRLVSTDTTWEEYTWPNILLNLRIILDQRLAGGGDSNTEPVDRGAWQDAQRAPSKVITRVYVSNTQPPDTICRARVPMPTSIRGDHNGRPIRLPECLHPEIVMRSTASEDAQIYDCTPSVPDAAYRSGDTLIQGPTNMLDWVTHIFSNTVVNQDGLYQRTERTVHPPARPNLQWTA